MTPILGILASGISGNLWAPGKDFDSIATVTLGTSASSITFSSIPQTYTHLQIRGILRSDRAGQTQDTLKYQFNGDTSSTTATVHTIRGDGASVTAAGAGNYFIYISEYIPAASVAASIFAGNVTDILDYKNTNKYKTVRTLNGEDKNGSGNMSFSSNAWINTAAITSITVLSDTGSNISQYSSLALYGIKG